jgi:hypothetical protein
MVWSAAAGLTLVIKVIRIIYVYLLIGVVKEDRVLLKLIAITFSAVMGIALARAIIDVSIAIANSSAVLK